MSDCSSIDGLVTPYVDGELPSAEQEAIDRHVRVCPPCRSRVMVERAVRDLLGDRRPGLQRDCAPASLRARCASLDVSSQPSTEAPGFEAGMARSWPGRHLVPVALAATVLLLVGGAWAYWAAAGSSRVMAAELAADHVKCLIMNAALGTRQSADMVEASMAADFDWDVHLPDGGEAQGLELVGSRRCLYLGGTIAHLMYRHQGQPVSVFMLPGTAYGDGFVEVLGHKCAIWSGGGRTFALVSEGTNADVEGLVTFAQATFH